MRFVAAIAVLMVMLIALAEGCSSESTAPSAPDASVDCEPGQTACNGRVACLSGHWFGDCEDTGPPACRYGCPDGSVQPGSAGTVRGCCPNGSGLVTLHNCPGPDCCSQACCDWGAPVTADTILCPVDDAGTDAAHADGPDAIAVDVASPDASEAGAD